MRRISILVTVLVTSLVMTLSGLGASPMASAASSQTVAKSFTFPTGSSDLTKAQKTKIKKVVATAGKNASFRVTGAAGKLPGVSDSTVQLLAKKRAQVVKAYLVKLGVKKSRVTIKLKITGLGIVPKTKLVGTYASATSTPAPTTYEVGDPGTGGGIIFYVDMAGFKCGLAFTDTGSQTGGKCHYLEVAPSGWENGGLPPTMDPKKPWAVTANIATDVPDITNETSANNTSAGIGLGYKNSVAIVRQGNDITTAAGAAMAYANNSKSDWYLPTTAELNLFCQWNRGVPPSVTTRCSGGTLNSPIYGASNSGFMDSSYWTSSESADDAALLQNFNMGVQGSTFKGGNPTFFSLYVRPIRAF